MIAIAAVVTLGVGITVSAHRFSKGRGVIIVVFCGLIERLLA
jgi:hypothetical protein